MKKIILVVLIILPFMGWAVDGNFVLKGKIGNGAHGAKIYLSYTLNGKINTVSTSCENGSFQFKGTLPEPKLAQLVLDHKGVGIKKIGSDPDVILLFLENGVITVSSKDFLKNAVITGSKLNDESKKCKELLMPDQLKMNSILTDFRNAPADKQKNEQFKAETENKLKALLANQNLIKDNFVKEHPASFLSLQMLMDALAQKQDLKKIKVLFNSLSSELRNSPSGKELNGKI